MEEDYDDKIIIKQYSQSAVSKAVLTTWNLSTVRVAKGKITFPITLIKNKYYFSSDLNLKGGDIIKIGKEIETKYRVLDDGVYNRQGMRLYRIKRLDNASMTVLDISNSKKGTIVFLNTPSDKEIFELINKI